MSAPIVSAPLSTDAFTVHATSGLVTSTRLLKSYERFNLTAVATDHGRPPLWGQAGLYVEVLDVNDHRPVFVLPPNGTVVNITEVMPVVIRIVITFTCLTKTTHFPPHLTQNRNLFSECFTR